ncbi:MAG TPA: FMN-binding protein [Candidatus Dormibacteraeota bacterium]|nr:FMN-binding protein [Candidatus Dormibacteraeota bacterium]
MERSEAKALAALALTGIGSALVVGFRVAPTTANEPVTASTGPSPAVVSAVPGGSSAASTPGATGTSGGPPASTGPGGSTGSTGSTGGTSGGSGTYANGTFTGTAVQEPWGSFQVQAVISGGRLTNVVVASEPFDGHSRRVNGQAVPILTQSAVAAQSANIDAVSGATWTSQSYATSLQAALDQAKAAAAATIG